MSDQTHRAYLIASCTTDTHMIRGMLQHSLISSAADVLLRNGSAPLYVIGRLASITANCFLTEPKMAIERITFLKDLLWFAYDTSVYGCFRLLLCSHSNMECFYDWLAKIDIGQTFVDVMMSINYERKIEGSEYNDEQFQLVSSIYQLIAIGADNMGTVSIFAAPKIIDALYRLYRNCPDYVQSSQWRAISAVCGPKTAKSMEKFLPTCFSILYSPTAQLFSHQVNCIMFLTQMIDFNKDVQEQILASQALSVILRIVVQFCDASILHQAFRRFVIHAMDKKALIPKVVELYVPMLISECWSRDHGILAATAWFLMMKFKEKAKSSKPLRKALSSIPEYEPFAKNELASYEETLSTSYGGPMPLATTAF